MAERNYHATFVFAGSGKEPRPAYAPVHSILSEKGDVHYIPQEQVYDEHGLRPTALDELNEQLEDYAEITIIGDSVGSLAGHRLASASARRRTTRLLAIDGPASTDYLLDEKEDVRIGDLRGYSEVTDQKLLESWRNRNGIRESYFIRKKLGAQGLEWFKADMEARSRFSLRVLGGQAIFLANGPHLAENLPSGTPFVHLQSRTDVLLAQPQTMDLWREIEPDMHVESVPDSRAHASVTVYQEAWQDAISKAYDYLDSQTRASL